ncbi:MAG TPA: hypothetical protein PKH93_01485 [Chitinophagales bacterium]|nr:hypothetical protein [Chitinophagales bacterium]HNL06211.1 hypothetical protein [Chitinophagales bacterium]
MKKIALLFLVVFGIACDNSNSKIPSNSTPQITPKKTLTSKEIDSILTQNNFEYESPIVLDRQQQVLIPLSGYVFHSKASYEYGYDYDTKDFVSHWNILFHNPITGASRLLTKNKVKIISFHTKTTDIEETKKILNNKILYDIVDTDFNNDQRLDENDPDYLFVSDINGENLQRISPQNEDLVHFEVLPKNQQILIQTIRDVNKDLHFNSEDETIWYEALLKSKEWHIQEMFDSTFRKQIGNIYFEQWIKPKMTTP